MNHLDEIRAKSLSWDDYYDLLTDVEIEVEQRIDPHEDEDDGE